MKTPKEIEQLAVDIYGKDETFDNNGNDNSEPYRIGCVKGYTQCQEDMVNKIQSLIDVYKSDILKLEEEFRDSLSLLTLREISTLQCVVTNLESKINK